MTKWTQLQVCATHKRIHNNSVSKIVISGHTSIPKTIHNVANYDAHSCHLWTGRFGFGGRRTCFCGRLWSHFGFWNPRSQTKCGDFCHTFDYVNVNSMNAALLCCGDYWGEGAQRQSLLFLGGRVDGGKHRASASLISSTQVFQLCFCISQLVHDAFPLETFPCACCASNKYKL